MAEHLADVLRILDEQLPADEKASIRALEENQLWELHLSLGAQIRGWFIHHHNSACCEELLTLLGDPDATSAFLSNIYWHHLRNAKITKELLLQTAISNSWCVDESAFNTLVPKLISSYQALHA